MKKIIIVEENPVAAGAILNLLAMNGYQGIIVDTNKQAYETFRKEHADAIFLKDKIPELSGYAAMKMLRKESAEVLIIIMGNPLASSEIVTALLEGANNYIPRNSKPDELLAYLVALLRTAGQQESEYQLNERVKLSVEAQTLRFPETNILLKDKECILLERLAKNKGKIVTIENLIRGIWPEVTPDTKTYLVKVITKIRKTLHRDPTLTIETIPGRGYMLMDYDAKLTRE